MLKQEAKQRIEKLKKEINHHRYLYHVLDKQEISEAALDSLKHELYKLEQQYPEFITPDSPTQRVGGQPLKEFKKVEHKIRMLSLQDVFDEQEIEDWQKRIKKLIPNEKLDYYAEVKMDGLAVSLIYKKGIFFQGSTRGNGIIGEDITQNLKVIEAIPLKLETENFFKEMKKNLPEEIEIRGEVFMSKKSFGELNKIQKKNNQPLFANPRNAAAGSLRQLDSKIVLSRKLDFYAYDLVADLSQKTHQESHQLAKLLGVKVNPESRYCRDLTDVAEYYRYIGKIRQNLPYLTDGIVVNVNNIFLFKKLGIVGKAPRAAVAFKYPAEQATTIVEDIIIQIGRTGALTPVAILEPVKVAGSTVSRATLHNEDEINRLGIKIGDSVIVQKAGDVIPDIVKVLLNLRTGKEKKFKFPSQCPVCGSAVIRKKGEVAHYCANKNCFAQNKENLYHFVSKSAFDIKHLGPKIIDKLLENGLIEDAADIFKLKRGDLEPIERFAEKSAVNLIEAINQSGKISLARLIYALGIRHIGEETAIDLADYFGSLEKIKNAGEEELKSVQSVGEVMAKSIYEWFRDKKNSRLLDKLSREIEIENIKVKKLKLKGKIFVLTGNLQSMTREEAKNKIRDLGGEISSSAGKNTDFAVAGAEPGSKYEKAERLGVKIIGEKEFLDILK
ncbi:MAG: DNA ligase (NAD+) [Parcubacteria group bacterium Athens1014_10]|nr:MAG: DNA ligase (NAD+) [Parcubacteria group bacterium Athens1014_10]TSD05239.1 MAG: DNA ligase (NAD+) [Parcubacteria group bacterium Athens0714_12]